MIYWNPLYEVSVLENSIIFMDERGHFNVIKDVTMTAWGLLKHLDVGIRYSDIAQASDVERKLLSLLAKKNLVVALPCNPAHVNFDRSSGHFLTYDRNPIAALEKLKCSQVCLLGVGGVGSVVLQHLVGIGISNFFLVDSDQVEASNLNRQFIFSANDIGFLKVDVARRYISSRLSFPQVSTSSCRIISIDDLEKLSIENSDIIINCLDTPRQFIDDIAYGYGDIKKIPVITAGVGVYFGHWGPLICTKENGLTYRDWTQEFLNKNNNPKPKTDRPTPWSFGPTNTLIGANLAREAIEWLAGRADVNSLNTRWVHRFSDHQITAYRTSSSLGKY